MKEEKTKRELVADKFYWLLRIGVLASIILMFFPGFNPVKVCSLVNKNMSYFTSAVSWTGLKQDVATGFRFGVVNESSFILLFVAAMVGVFAILVLAAGGCMSLGNLRFKRLGNLFTLLGSLITGVSLYMINMGKNQIDQTVSKSDDAATISVGLPTGFYVFVVLVIVIAIISLINIVLLPRVEKGTKFAMETKFKLFLIMLPFITLIFVFSYLPLFGWRYAFYDYKPGVELTSDNFVGFKWFAKLLGDAKTRSDVLIVLRNTLAMSGLGLITSWLPMAFAIFLNEIKGKWFKRIVQLFTTIPNFVSWVLVYSLAFAMFSTDGFINTLLGTSTQYLMQTDFIWIKMLLWGIWKGIGWSAIIYIAGISGIDPQLYEAATVDGAGRARKMWHITVPGLLPTFFVLLLMSVANILTNGMDQYMVFENSQNTKVIKVLDLYVYKLGLEATNTIPLSTVVSMTKSIVSVILLFAANGVSKLIRGESIM